jgi:hypothetical protein
MQVAGIALVHRLGPEAGDAPALVVGGELGFRPMGFSMAHTKQMRELGCLSMIGSPCAAFMIASMKGLGTPPDPKL